MGKIDKRTAASEKIRKHENYLRKKDHYKAMAKAWQLANREKDKARRRASKAKWYAANKAKNSRECFRRSLPRKYGITSDEYDAMIVSQDGRCKLCQKILVPGRFTHLDHDHATGTVRGILCIACNMRIGHIEFNGPEWLSRAISHIWNGRYGAWPPAGW